MLEMNKDINHRVRITIISAWLTSSPDSTSSTNFARTGSCFHYSIAPFQPHTSQMFLKLRARVNPVATQTWRRWQSAAVHTTQEPPQTISIVSTVHQLAVEKLHQADFLLSLVSHLQNRSLVESITSEDLYKLTEPGSAKLKLYCGADPSAKSLHLGNLLPLMVLLHFVLRGHDVVGLVGGATGVVGDPSGRTTERSQLAKEERETNVRNIQSQIQAFLTKGIEYAKSRNVPAALASQVGTISLVNNADWWADVKLLDFLASYGRFIRVSQMLARDSVLSRLESQAGLGFNEFTYQVLQAYDFWHLFKNENVNVQVGGNDQWGNITAGTDLISRVQKQETGGDKPAYGITVPLLTTSSGQKFGKSAGNAIFISLELTSPFQMYQYFINTQDDMVAKLLKALTLLPLESMESVLAQHTEDPTLRVAQRVLAREVVDLIHGPGVGDQMAYITGFLFPTPDQPFDDEISAEKLLQNFDKSGILQKLSLGTFKDSDDIKLSTLLATIMGRSKNEVRNLIKAGGVYLGVDRDQLLDTDDVVLFDKDKHLIEDRLLLVRSGKQNYFLVEITP